MTLKAFFVWLLSVMILWTQAYSTEVTKETGKLQDPPGASSETPPTTLGIHKVNSPPIAPTLTVFIHLLQKRIKYGS